ncbi:MAG: lipopolysaccharide biosynthesis protein [Oscillospiraceae bacterium]|nr:lipopolysaccharide biosynthesis protein [Oscillospiraceae bacterium]
MTEREELNRRIGRATKWSTATQICTKLITPITNAILARLLAPEAFGVVATLTMVVSFAEIFTDAGFQKYLIQHEFKNEEELQNSTNVAFWTNLLLSLVIWAGIALFAEPIAVMVGSPGCGLAVTVIGLQIPVLAFSSIQMARYRRDFNFKTLFAVRVVTAAVPLVVTVPLALVFRSYWALVVGTLARDVLSAIILTARSPWKIRFWYSFQRLKEMISFSLWTVVENISIWLTSYVGVFIVSAALNEHYLGLYKTSMSTVNAYMGVVTGATTQVLFAALSRCQEDFAAFKSVFLKFQRMVALLVFPMGFGLFVYRELATSILLGEQWLETADFLGMWSLTSAVMIVFDHYCSEVFRSIGKPKISVLMQVLHLLVLIPVLIWAAGKNYAFLTTARALVRLESILVSCIFMQHIAGIKFTSVVKNVWPSLVASIVMAVCGSVLRRVFPGVAWEVVTILLCVVIYAVVMFLQPAGRRQLAEIPILKKLLRLQDSQQSK